MKLQRRRDIRGHYWNMHWLPRLWVAALSLNVHAADPRKSIQHRIYLATHTAAEYVPEWTRLWVSYRELCR